LSLRTDTGNLIRRVARALLGAGGLLIAGAAWSPACAQAPSSASSARIAVVKSLDLPEYNLAFEGFLNQLNETGHQATTVPFVLGATDSASDNVWQRVRAAHPDLILALGSRAAREAELHEPSTPIVYSMVLSPMDEGSGPGGPQPKNLTGATLCIPLETQLREIVRVFPTARRIGMISDPKRSGTVVDSARHLVSERAGFSLRVAAVASEQMIPDAVRALRDSIDVFWMIPDETVLTPRSSRFIIFEMIKAGIPVVGLSSAYVKAGALLALECDYTDVGRQSGELAIRILSGQSPAHLPHTSPRTYIRAVNLKVREHLRIPVDDSVVKDSNVVVF